jgi:hypothetical protein
MCGFGTRIAWLLGMWACTSDATTAACVAAVRAEDPRTGALCERAWLATGQEANAVDAARHALAQKDDVRLERLAGAVPATVEGARIFLYWGQRLQQRGEQQRATAMLTKALAIQRDRDPARATNSALALFELSLSQESAEASIELARLTWEQAKAADNALARGFAAGALVELLIDLGELAAARAVIQDLFPAEAPALRAMATGRLETALGHGKLAAAWLERADRAWSHEISPTSALQGAIELVQARLALGQRDEARAALERARAIQRDLGTWSSDDAARLAAVEAGVRLADGEVDAALAIVANGLAPGLRDAARLRLLNVRADALARRGDQAAAEAAWREAADSVEAWRASIPTIQLRGGLVARHRYALESWLDSTGQRGDVAGALEVTRRMVGRGLLDRIRHREANAPATADASIRDVVRRLAVGRELAATMAGARDLRDVTDDLVVAVSGLRSVWAVRRLTGAWSIRRVGNREVIAALVDAYRRDPDDRQIAAELGGALFPLDTLPRPGAPLVVMLDRELADVALAGLRVGGRYLVERVDLLELLAPELAFAMIPDRRWGPAVAIGDAARDLPSAAREVAAVARVLGGSAAVGERATREALERGRDASVLHLATHANLADGRAAFVLADGAVSSHDILTLKIAPRLAVIATCRSQVDDDPETSLVAAFLAAGTPGVIGVKRAADDAASALLMAELYRVGGADDPMRGLARAQRAAIAANRPPRTWATVAFFGVIGWLRLPRR